MLLKFFHLAVASWALTENQGGSSLEEIFTKFFSVMMQMITAGIILISRWLGLSILRGQANKLAFLVPTAAFLGAILLFSEAPMYSAIQNGIGF